MNLHRPQKNMMTHESMISLKYHLSSKCFICVMYHFWKLCFPEFLQVRFLTTFTRRNKIMRINVVGYVSKSKLLTDQSNELTVNFICVVKSVSNPCPHYDNTLWIKKDTFPYEYWVVFTSFYFFLLFRSLSKITIVIINHSLK